MKLFGSFIYNLSSMELKKGDDIVYLTESENELLLDIKLNVNGGINAHHYLNFIGTIPVTFVNPEQKDTIKKGMLLSSFDFINSENIKKSNCFNVTLTTKEKDKKCIGIYYGNNQEDTRIDFATITGITEILITNLDEQNIEIGDYLTSSNISGYAVKQQDDIRYNYTICKSLENINWNNVNKCMIVENKKYKVIKVKCMIV